MDDKPKIPAGDPGVPEAATSHIRKAVTTKKLTLESSDHNNRSVNLTPSVTLLCDLPEKATGSFFTGQVYVGIKDSIFEPSDRFRHVVELLSVLWKEEENFFSIPYYFHRSWWRSLHKVFICSVCTVTIIQNRQF